MIYSPVSAALCMILTMAAFVIMTGNARTSLLIMMKAVTAMNERVVFVCVCIAGIGFFLQAIILFCRFLKKPSKYRLIECYVDPAAYDRLQLMADDCGLSLSTFCSCALECIDPTELNVARIRTGVDQRG